MVLRLVAPLIAVFGVGLLAVALYRRHVPGIGLHSATGARLGVLASFFCFVMTTVMGVLRVIVFREGEQIRQMWLDYIQQTAARYPDPQYQSGLDFMRSPGGFVLAVICFLIFALVVFLILGALGGALGGSFFGRHDKS